MFFECHQSDINFYILYPFIFFCRTGTAGYIEKCVQEGLRSSLSSGDVMSDRRAQAIGNIK